MDLRKSHENSAVKKLYEEYFGEPNSHKAHEVLHTHYIKRGLWSLKKGVKKSHRGFLTPFCYDAGGSDKAKGSVKKRILRF